MSDVILGVKKMADAINLDYKPKSYFGPRRLEEYLISQVKGAVARERLEALFNEARYDEVAALLGEHGLSKADLKPLGVLFRLRSSLSTACH